jgi:hypothetical protein
MPLPRGDGSRIDPGLRRPWATHSTRSQPFSSSTLVAWPAGRGSSTAVAVRERRSKPRSSDRGHASSDRGHLHAHRRQDIAAGNSAGGARRCDGDLVRDGAQIQRSRDDPQSQRGLLPGAQVPLTVQQGAAPGAMAPPASAALWVACPVGMPCSTLVHVCGTGIAMLRSSSSRLCRWVMGDGPSASGSRAPVAPRLGSTRQPGWREDGLVTPAPLRGGYPRGTRIGQQGQGATMATTDRASEDGAPTPLLLTVEQAAAMLAPTLRRRCHR